MSPSVSHWDSCCVWVYDLDRVACCCTLLFYSTGSYRPVCHTVTVVVYGSTTWSVLHIVAHSCCILLIHITQHVSLWLLLRMSLRLGSCCMLMYTPVLFDWVIPPSVSHCDCCCDEYTTWNCMGDMTRIVSHSDCYCIPLTHITHCVAVFHWIIKVLHTSQSYHSVNPITQSIISPNVSHSCCILLHTPVVNDWLI